MNMLIKLFLSLCFVSFSFYAHADEHSNQNKGSVLVVGATGGTGQLTVEKLVAEGYQVRAMVRNLEKGKKLLNENVELMYADVTKPETLPKTMVGMDYLVSTLGTPGGANAEAIDYIGAVAVMDAAKAAGIKKFVFTTSGGTTWWIHPLNWFANNVLKWKHKAELHLRASGLTHVIVRPAGGLTDNPGNREKIIFTQKDGIPSRISRDDVATVLVQALAMQEADNKTFEILNNDDGEVVSEVDWPATFSGMLVQSDNF